MCGESRTVGPLYAQHSPGSLSSYVAEKIWDPCVTLACEHLLSPRDKWRRIGRMPDIATVLKSEISRLARKELRTGTESTNKAVAAYRHEIAALKRRLQALEKEVGRLRKQDGKSKPARAEPVDATPALRFRAGGFAMHRQRLGLSAKEMGLLLDASPLSVYKWEQGQARPRAKHLAAIAALRKLGKREAQRRLEELAAG